MKLLSFLTRPVVRLRPQVILALATFALASNLILNVWVAERVFSPDHSLLSRTRNAIYVYHLATVVLVVALALFRRKLRGAIRVYHLALLFALGEIAFRVIIFSPAIQVPLIEKPSWYADGNEDGYFVLLHYFSGTEWNSGRDHDPELGWSVDDPDLQLLADRYRRSRSDAARRALFFFGDSFVTHGAPDHTIARYLEPLLPDVDVLNYGVPGYGTDQTTILFKKILTALAPAPDKSIVLLGVLLDDMDRALLRFRTLVKPYYEKTDSGYVLRPPMSSNQEFVDQHHFYGKSFLLSALASFVQPLIRWDPKADERRDVNRHIFTTTVSFIRERDLPTCFVIFYDNDLLWASPRERELKGILDDLHFPCVIDTKPILLRHMKEADKRIEGLYDETWHHRFETNGVLARGIADELRAHAILD